VTELLRFQTDDNSQIVVEVGEQEAGVVRVSRSGGFIDVRQHFDEALAQVRDAATRALEVFRDGTLCPDEVELEFGVRLNAEVGAVIAKTATEGHLVVRLKWSGTEPAAHQPESG
jgi:hypothetical protein